jgi:transcriptional regulator with XRE-family HTH domain
MKIKYLLFNARKATGLSQARFGKLFDVSQPLVSGWEDSSRVPSRHQLEIAKIILAADWSGDQRYKAVAWLIQEGRSAHALAVAMGGEIPGKVMKA